MELSKERGLILPSRDLNGIRANTLPGAAIPVKMAASCCRRPQVRYAQWVSPCCGANRFNEQHCQYNGWHRSYFQEILHRGKQGSLPRKRHRTLTQRHSGSIRKLIPLTSSGPFVPMQPVSATSIRPNPLIFISRPA